MVTLVIEIMYNSALTSVSVFFPLFLSLMMFYLFVRWRLKDYAIFGMIFFMSSIAAYSSNLVKEYPATLLFYQLLFMSSTATFYFLLVHIRNLRSDKIGSLQFYAETGYFVAVLIVISLWQLVKKPYNTGNFVLALPSATSKVTGYTAGIILQNGKIIFSSVHPWFLFVFWAYIAVKSLHTYVTLGLEFHNSKLRRIKHLWTFNYILITAWTLNILIFNKYYVQIDGIVAGIYLLTAYITLRYKQAMLLTTTQIRKSMKMYQNKLIHYNADNQLIRLSDSENNLVENLADFSSIALNKLRGKSIDTPRAMFILSETDLLKTIEFDSNIKYTQIMGNFLSALLIFSNEKINREDHLLRFKIDKDNIIVGTYLNFYFCYLYTGDTFSAEIRLKKFIENPEANKFWYDLRKSGDLMLYDRKTNENIKRLIESTFT